MKAPDMIGACTNEGLPLRPVPAPWDPGVDELAIGDGEVALEDDGKFPGWNPTKLPEASYDGVP